MESAPAATLNGRQLCSRHKPLEEARRAVDEINLHDHAAVVVLGFGLGYHVQQLAARAGKTTLIIVFEPDIALLKSVFEAIDHSAWMKGSLLLFITDERDRGTLARKLQGTEAILAQGVHFFEHAPSRARIHAESAAFTSLFAELISAAKTTLATTLMRSVDTTRNLLLNIDHYAAGSGITDLQNAAKGLPAIVVSAGPSLHRNVLRLHGMEDKCVIIAVQTTLKPLLAAGIKPHFVTALDYHEISKRFYEDLSADDLRGITLIADPKAHPAILDAFPGAIRCCASPFLDTALGDLRRDMGQLAAGATVAHLALYLAKYLGCNPIGFIGQDLGFTDGLYYAPHTAIHDVWAPELNAFNTIEMMEWQRIARHRLHLRKLKDVEGKSIYTDAQMHAYLQQFERDFLQCRQEGLTIIDATEGGVAKQHVESMPLQAFLDQFACERTLPELPLAPIDLDSNRTTKIAKRLRDLRKSVETLRRLSQETADVLRDMIAHQHDLARMTRNFRIIERHRRAVESHMNAFELLNTLNQLGMFNRMKADRRLQMQPNLTPLERQRGELERDLANVTWIADAAIELLSQLESADRVLRRSTEAFTIKTEPTISTSGLPLTRQATIAALIPIDPDRSGLGLRRSLTESMHGRSVLQATLERLGQSKGLGSIVLIAPKSMGIDAYIDRAAINLPVFIEETDATPYGPEHAAIAVARLWATSSWRGGIAGMSIFDEVLCPVIMHEIMVRRGLSAAVVAGPDWPLIQVDQSSDCGGCDALIARHLEHPVQHRLVFTQAPPGLSACLIAASLMQELSQRNRLSTIGSLLVYQPHAPQGDPIARDCNVQIAHRVRGSLVRATADTSRQRSLLSTINDLAIPAVDLIAKIERAELAASHGPCEIVLELCTDRTSRGFFWANREARAPITPRDAAVLFEQTKQFAADDLLLTLGGSGDPLLHPQFDVIVQIAKNAGIRSVRVRTELLADQTVLRRLLSCGVDVVSVDLNADCAATFSRMMGLDEHHFRTALRNLEYLLENRNRLDSLIPAAGFGLPWIVPHIQRCRVTYEDIDTFYDRWLRLLGCAVIEGIHPNNCTDDLAPAFTPQRVVDRDRRHRMFVRCDGQVARDFCDSAPSSILGRFQTTPISTIWSMSR